MQQRYDSRTEALRAAAVCLNCDESLRGWTWRFVILDLTRDGQPIISSRITAVEEFDGWIVVARLPIPETDLPWRDALLEAGVGLSMMWNVGKESPGTTIAIAENQKELVWPEGAKPAGVLAQSEGGPVARIMTETHAEDLLSFMIEKAQAITESIETDDIGPARRFERERPDEPPWLSESELDPLDLENQEDLLIDSMTFSEVE